MADQFDALSHVDNSTGERPAAPADPRPQASIIADKTFVPEIPVEERLDQAAPALPPLVTGARLQPPAAVRPENVPGVDESMGKLAAELRGYRVKSEADKALDTATAKKQVEQETSIAAAQKQLDTYIAAIEAKKAADPKYVETPDDKIWRAYHETNLDRARAKPIGGVFGNWSARGTEESKRDANDRLVTAQSAFDVASKAVAEITAREQRWLRANPGKPLPGMFDDHRRPFALNLARRKKDLEEARDIVSGKKPGITMGPVRAKIEGFAEGAWSIGTGIMKSAGIGAALAGRAAGYDYKPEDMSVFQLAEKFDKAAKEAFPGDAARQRDFTQMLSQGAGSAIGFYGPAIVGKLLGASTSTLVALTAGTGAMAQGSETFDDATKSRKAGRAVTEQDRYLAWAGGLLLGTSEAMPIAAMLTSPRARAVHQILIQAAEEGGQEGFQTLGSNLLAKGIHDPSRDLAEGLPEAIAIGALIGGGMQMAHSALRRDDAPATPAPATPAPATPAPATPAPATPAPATPAPATPVRPTRTSADIGAMPIEARPSTIQSSDDTVVTPDGTASLPVETVIVDLSSLVFAAGDLQPRDRSRKESDEGVRYRAANLDPGRLMPARVSDSGAPIITSDGTIISGNGRVMSIAMAYGDQNLAARADAYRAALGADAEGIAQPVLVRRVKGDVPREALIAFADKSNIPSIAELSATERAQRDARAAGNDIMQLYQGGSFASPENAPFLRAFVGKAVSQSERGGMAKDGFLTKPGEDRLSSAVLSAAYGDPELLSRMLESTDDNVKAITGAMRDAAGAIMQLHASIAAGTTDPAFDITPQLVEAVKLIASMRDRGIKPAQFLAQQDAFSKADPIVEAVIRGFYNADMSRANSRAKLTDFLKSYAEEARKHSGEEALFADETTPQDVLRVARTLADGAGELFDTGTSPDGGLDAADGQAGARPATDGSGQEARAEDPRDRVSITPTAGPDGTSYDILVTGFEGDGFVGPEASGAWRFVVTHPSGQAQSGITTDREQAFRAALDLMNARDIDVTGAINSDELAGMAMRKRDQLAPDLFDLFAAPALEALDAVASEVATALEPLVSDELRVAFQREIVGDRPAREWQGAIGATNEQYDALISEALDAGHIRVTKQGQVRRTPKGKALKPVDVGAVAAKPARPAPATAPETAVGAAAPGADLSPLEQREAAARVIMEGPEWTAATLPDRSRDTAQQPGFMSDDWKASRVYQTEAGPVTGYDAAVQFLIDDAIAKVPGEFKRERKLFVLLGLPGAGKSTIARAIGARHGAAHMVADDAKLIIPEYDGGANSGGVHEESSLLAKDVLREMADTGGNVIMEKLGSSTVSIDKLVSQFAAVGYTTHVVYVNVPKALAMERAISRWQKTGRAVPLQEYDVTASNLPRLIPILKGDRRVDETAEVRFDEARGSWELVESTGLEVDGLWPRAGAPVGDARVDRVGRDADATGGTGRSEAETSEEGRVTPGLIAVGDALDLQTAIAERETELRRPLPQVVVSAATRIVESSPAEIRDTIREISGDPALRKADALELARLLGYPPTSRTTKAQALNSIADRIESLSDTAAVQAAVAEEAVAVAAERATYEAATAPTFEQIRLELPLDLAGDPDTAVLMQAVEQAGARAWSALTDEAKRAIWQDITGNAFEGVTDGSAELRDDAGELPQDGVSVGLPVDEAGRDAEGTPRDDRAAGDGDVRGTQGANVDRADGATGSRREGVVPRKSAADLQRDRERRTRLRAVAAEAEQKRRDRIAQNYRITPDDQIGQGGDKAKVRANIEALKLLRTLEQEGRTPTDDEKKILVKYTGWGAFSQAMFDKNPNSENARRWKEERAELQNLLSVDEWASASASTLNAHYTSEDVINGVWRAVQHLGFTGGRAIEPSAGVGHFIGLAPENLRETVDWSAVELDTVTGGILKALYGGTDVRVAGFETQTWPNDFFDLAISNVPFGDFSLTDRAYKRGLLIHDYFFVKSLDKVRPGGLVAFITSHGTLDKLDAGARREMAKRGTFLGTIRLPGGKKGAFQANAGTDVTTDVIFFRKRLPGEPEGDTSWIGSSEIEDGQGGTYKLNDYFRANPGMMLGKMEITGGRFQNAISLIGTTENLAEQIAEAAANLEAGAFIPRGSAATTPVIDAAVDTETDGIKAGAYYEKAGKIYRKVMGVGEPQNRSPAAMKKLRAFMAVRDAANRVLAAQAAQRPADEARAQLNLAYDAFVAAYGPISRVKVTVTNRKNKKGEPVVIRKYLNFNEFKDDPDAYKVLALELYDEKKDTAEKAAIFTRDVISTYTRPVVTGPADALAVSLNVMGYVHIPTIANDLGLSEDEAIDVLGDTVFLDPKGETWRTRADYLSGDVVTKLSEAKAAAVTDERFVKNVAALEAVQPPPLTRVDIRLLLGASWVPARIYEEFVQKVTGARKVSLTLLPGSSAWKLSGDLPYSAETQFGLDRRGAKAKDVIEAALNSGSITLKKNIGTTAEPQLVVDQEATELVTQKIQGLRDLFAGSIERGVESWAWENETRAQELEALYNGAFNRLVPEVHDGSHLTFPGLAKVISFPGGETGEIRLDPHRTSAIWRIVSKGNTLLNHVVGSGKTFSMIMSGMEQKRLGLIAKPAYVVPNHMLEQFSREFLQAYPAAKLLIADKDSMSKDRRKEFAARAATENWDGVIITHDAFGRVGMTEEYQRQYIRAELAEMLSFIETARAEDGKGSATVKDLEKAAKRLKERLDKLMNKERKDEGITFEELGIDFLYVDEAHLFKNLGMRTRHTRVKGMSKSSSQRATDMFMKIQYLEQSRPGRAAVFATGTPVSNSMAEFYTMQRYLQSSTLKEYGIDSFDAWAGTFGEITTQVELAPNGRDMREVRAFQKFVNIPELMTLFGQVADTQTAAMLNLPRPKLMGGKPIVVSAEPSPQEELMMDALVKRAENIKGKRPEKGADNMLKIMGEGLQLGVDAGLLDPSLPFNETGKVALAIDNIARIYKAGKEPAMAQIVFLDMGVPGSKARGAASVGEQQEIIDEDGEIVDDSADIENSIFAGKFELYQDIKDRLIAKGIPAEEIAFIHDANNDVKKAQLFDKVRSGKVRVLLGTTGKMGVGTNVQARLIAMHHLDAPWRPADLEQRDGRILRQGNKNPEIQIYRYITKRTLDAYRWQTLEAKSSFIAQLQAGARGVREAEDIDSPLPEAAAIKAAATDNPLIMEHAELKKKVRELEATKRGFERSIAAARSAYNEFDKRRTSLQRAMSLVATDAAGVTDLRGENFSVTIGVTGEDVTFTDRTQAADLLKAYMVKLGKGIWSGTPTTDYLGTIAGLRMRTDVKRMADGPVMSIGLEGAGTYGELDRFFVLNDDTSFAGVLSRYVNLVEGLPKLLRQYQQEIERIEQDLPRLASKAQAAAFPRAEELAEAQARVAEIENLLNPEVQRKEAEARAQAQKEADEALAAAVNEPVPPKPTFAISAVMDDPAIARGEMVAAQQAAETMLKMKRPYKVKEGVKGLVAQGIARALNMVPADVDVGILAGLKNVGTEDINGRKVMIVEATFEDARSDRSFTARFSWDDFRRARAFTVRKELTESGRAILVFNRVSEVGLTDQLLTGEVWHENLHRLWQDGRLGAARDRLLAHAKLLNMLEVPLRTALQVIGEPSWPNAMIGKRIGDAYVELYDGRADLKDMMQQEAVAHMLELYSHGYFTAEQMADVQDIVDDMRDGVFAAAAQGGNAATALMAALRVDMDVPPGLDMSDSARRQRAEEMGFDTGTTWYHGTNEPLEEIRPGMRDPGAWFTTDLMNASNYARGSDAQVYSVYLKAQKPFVVEAGDDGAGGFVPMYNGSRLDLESNVEIVRHAERSGFDSVHFPDGNFSESGNTMVVFSANQIGDTDAAFDPARSDSAQILARLSDEQRSEAISTALLSPEVQMSIIAEARKILPADVTIRLEDSIRLATGEAISGAYDASARLLRLALDVKTVTDVLAIARHEAVHAARQMNLFTRDEWSALLERAAKVGIDQSWQIDVAGTMKPAIGIYENYYRRSLSIRGMSGASLEARISEYLNEERVAHMLETWVEKKTTYGKVIDALLARIGKLLEALVNGLRGAGFRSTMTADDVVARFLSGEVAARANAPATGRDVLFESAEMAAVEEALGVATTVMPSFAGERAKTADLEALNRAKEMETSGTDRTAIWTATGWFRGVDGKWRFEIDDRGSTARPTQRGLWWSAALPDGLTHDSLYGAYPELRKISADLSIDENASGVGSFEKPRFTTRPKITVRQKDNDALKSTTLHEVTHGIQRSEGFATGGSPKSMEPVYQGEDVEEAVALRGRILRLLGLSNDVIDGLSDPRIKVSEWIDNKESLDPDLVQRLLRVEDLIDRAAREQSYRMLAGEVEARTVQRRMDLTSDQRRARPPWEDYDVPEGEQIVRFGDGGPMLSIGPKATRLAAEGTAAHWINRNERAVQDWRPLFEAGLPAVAEIAEQRFQTSSSDDAIKGASTADLADYYARQQDNPNQVDMAVLNAINVGRRKGGAAGVAHLEAAVLQRRIETLTAWRRYLTEINSGFAADPFWRDFVWSGLLSDIRKNSPNQPRALNAAALGDAYIMVKNDPDQRSFATIYDEALAEIIDHQIDAKNRIEIGESKTWVRVPATREEHPDFEKNTDMVRALSCSTWCTSGGAANIYLPMGDFWVLTDAGRTRMAISFEGPKVAEIQGPANDGHIPPLYVEDVQALIDTGEIQSTDYVQRSVVKAREMKEKIARVEAMVGRGEMVEAFAELGFEAKLLDGGVSVETPRMSFDGRIAELPDATQLALLGSVTEIDGNLYVWEASPDWPSVHKITGRLTIFNGDARATLPELRTVTQGVSVIRSDNKTVDGIDSVYGGKFIEGSAQSVADAKAALSGKPRRSLKPIVTRAVDGETLVVHLDTRAAIDVDKSSDRLPWSSWYALSLLRLSVSNNSVRELLSDGYEVAKNEARSFSGLRNAEHAQEMASSDLSYEAIRLGHEARGSFTRTWRMWASPALRDALKGYDNENGARVAARLVGDAAPNRLLFPKLNKALAKFRRTENRVAAAKARVEAEIKSIRKLRKPGSVEAAARGKAKAFYYQPNSRDADRLHVAVFDDQALVVTDRAGKVVTGDRRTAVLDDVLRRKQPDAPSAPAGSDIMFALSDVQTGREMRRELETTRSFSIPLDGFDGTVTARPGDKRVRTYRLADTDGNPAAFAVISESTDGTWAASMVHVAPSHRRRDLGESLLGAIETDIGQRLAPSGWLSRAGHAYWSAIEPQMVAEHKAGPDSLDGLYLGPDQIRFALSAAERGAAAGDDRARDFHQMALDLRRMQASGGGDVLPAMRSGPSRPINIGGDGTGDGTVERGLSDLVTEVRDAIGVPVRMGRLDPVLKAAARAAGAQVMGQYNRRTGVIRQAVPNDLGNLAHEGGHALEDRADMRDAVRALKDQHQEELTTPAMPDFPAPPFAPTGYAGVEADADTVRLLADVVVQGEQSRALVTAGDRTAADKLARDVGAMRDMILRRMGASVGNAMIADAQANTNASDPAGVRRYLDQRFARTGTPDVRQTIVPSDPALSEGWAEWFATYLVAPDLARRQGPVLYNAFEDMLDARDPDLLEKLEGVQEGYQALLAAKPTEAVKSRVKLTRSPTWLEAAGKAYEDGAINWRNIGIGAAVGAGAGFMIAAGPAASVAAMVAGPAIGAALGGTIGQKFYQFQHGFLDRMHPLKVAVDYLTEVAARNTGVALAPGEKIAIKAMNDPYKRARLAEHSRVHATAILQQGVTFAGETEPQGTSLRAALIRAFGGTGRDQWNDEKSQDFGSYLAARRMLAEFDRFDRKELENLPDLLIQRGVWQKARDDFEQANPDFVPAADMVYAFLGDVLKWKLENGFITQDLYDDLIQRTDYVPLNRVMDDGPSQALTKASGQNKAKMIHRYLGSTRDIINPIESITQDVYATTARVALNGVIKAMVNLAESVGPGGGVIAERIPAKEMKGRTVDIREALKAAAKKTGLATDDVGALLDLIDDMFDQDAAATIFRATDTNERGEPILYLWEGGKRVPIRIGDDRIAKDIFDTFVALGQQNQNMIIDTLALSTQALRAGVTKSPAYVVVNYLRDQLQTWILGDAYTPFVTGGRGLMAINRGGTIGAAIGGAAGLAAGAATGGLGLAVLPAVGLLVGATAGSRMGNAANMNNPEAMLRYGRFAGMMGGVDANLIDTMARKKDATALRSEGFLAAAGGSRAGEMWYQFLRAMEVTEAATRIGHFDAVFQRAIADGMTREEAAWEAAYTSHDVMDFSRRGARTAEVARIIAFLNAAAQGMDVGRRSAMGERDTLENYRELMTPYARAINGSPLTIAEKKGLPISVRMWIKMAGLGLLSVALMSAYHDDEEYEEFSDQMKATHWFFKVGGIWWRFPKPFELATIANAFEASYGALFKADPRAFQQFRNALGNTMVPPHEVNAIKTFYEMSTGVNTFRGRPIEGQDIRALPPEMRFNAYTSELAKMLGKVTGTSPAQVDHLISSMFATVGRDVQSLSDYVLPSVNQAVGGALPGVSVTPRAEKSVEDYWFISRMSRRAARGALSTENFWKQMGQDGGKYAEAAAGYKRLYEAGRADPVRSSEAAALLKSMDDDRKAFAYLETNFKERDQDLHPMNRALQAISVMSGIRKDMVLGSLVKQSTKWSASKPNREPEAIKIDPARQKVVNEILEDLSMREARNALIAAGFKDWRNKRVMPIEGLRTELERVAPEVHEEMVARMKKGNNKIYTFESVRRLWPLAKERLLKDGAEANLSDIRVEAERE